MTNAIADKMSRLGACKEGREWIEQTNQLDFARGWKSCPAPEFMCWTLTRLFGLAGVRAAVQCSKVVVAQSDIASLKATIALCEQVADGKSHDTNQLQIMAYDATEAAMQKKHAHGSAFLLSASYAAYACHLAHQSALDANPDVKLKHLLKAAQHSSDATSHAKHGLPPKTNLVAVVRATIPDDAVLKAWLSAK